MLHQVRLSSGELFFVPVMDRDGLGSRCKVIPQVFYELKLLQGLRSKMEIVVGFTCRTPAM